MTERDVFLDKNRWTEVFSEFEIVDVAVQERGVLHLCARLRMTYEEASHLWDHDIATRIIVLYTDSPKGENCGFQELIGMAHPVLGVSRKPFPRPSGLVCAMNHDGDVWPRGGGVDGPMEHVAPGEVPGTKRLKCIYGFTYSVGLGRAVYQRVEVGKWMQLQEGLPKVECSTKQGFKDMDAFSETDMFAVGGYGDVWHFNGTRWEQMGFPSNVQLNTVTCAGDGNVYISGLGGSLWVGGKSTWKPVYEGSASVPWNDALWFGDKLWVASDYQFCQLNGRNLDPVMHAGEPVPINGHMDVYDGLLVIASAQHVQSFDGTTWRRLIEPYYD